MKKSITIAAAMAAAALLLAGCTETPGEVVGQPDSAPEVVESAPAPAPPEAGTADLGDTVLLGDWEVTVTEVVTNANALIADANEFNDPPEGQYVLVQYDATYRGDDRTADALLDLYWQYAGTDSTVYDQAYAVTPLSDEPTEARTDGTVTGDVAFDVPPQAIDGGLVMVENFIGNEYAEFVVTGGGEAVPEPAAAVAGAQAPAATEEALTQEEYMASSEIYYAADPSPMAGVLGCDEGSVQTFEGAEGVTVKMVCTVGGTNLEVTTYDTAGAQEQWLAMGAAMWDGLHVGVGQGVTTLSLDPATTDAAAAALGIEVRDIPAP